MDSNTKKSLADYMKEVEPYEKEETWVDDCSKGNKGRQI